MNLQEQISRMKSIMGVIKEGFDIDWQSKKIKPRNRHTTVLFLSPEKIWDRISTDSPDIDIRNNPSLRISDRLERAKEFLSTHGADSNNEFEEEEIKFEPTIVYTDPYNNNENGEPKIGIEDGRHRLLAALELGLKEFPVEVYPRDEEYFRNNFQP